MSTAKPLSAVPDAQHVEESVASTRMPVIVKLAQIMGEMDRIAKNGYNKFHNYSYVQEADIVEAIRTKLAERSVMLIPSVTRVERTPLLRTDSNGKPKESLITTMYLRFTFVDGESGDSYSADWTGDGEDGGDKGMYKALTGAEKYFLLKTFMISTGDDPEHDSRSRNDNRQNQNRQPQRQGNNRSPQSQQQRTQPQGASQNKPTAAAAPNTQTASSQPASEPVPERQYTAAEARQRNEFEAEAKEICEALGRSEKEKADIKAHIEELSLDAIPDYIARLRKRQEKHERQVQYTKVLILAKELHEWDEAETLRYIGVAHIENASLDLLNTKLEELEADKKKIGATAK